MPDGAPPAASTTPAAGADVPACDKTLNAEVRRICMIEGGYPGKWPSHARCPCCGTGELRSLFSKQEFNHDQCTNCGFVCVNPYPPDDIIRKLYAGAYYTNFREFYEARHLREIGGHSITAAPLELIEEMIEAATAGRAEGRWLDVGGGLGTVADLIRSRRPGWDVTLNEFNPRSIELAKEIYGLDVVSSDARDLYQSGRRFDVISAVSVLEHVSAPLSFVEAYARLLTDGGMMAIIVPQFTTLNAAVSRAAAPNATPPFHVSLFQRSNLRCLLERTEGFENIRISQFGPPAFSLLHHYDTSSYWDVSIPSAEEPVPKNLKLRDYPVEMAVGLNALEQAERAVGDYFAETDGRLYVMALAQRQMEIRSSSRYNRCDLRETRPLRRLSDTFTAVLRDLTGRRYPAASEDSGSSRRHIERFATILHDMKQLLMQHRECIRIGQRELKRLSALVASVDGFAGHDPELADLLRNVGASNLACELRELVERDADDAENDLRKGEQWGRCLLKQASEGSLTPAFTEVLCEWASTRVAYWTGRAAGLEAALAGAQHSLTGFESLAAAAAAGASLVSLQQVCLAEARRLDGVYRAERASLVGTNRDAAPGILDLRGMSYIETTISRSEASHRFYLAARRLAGWPGDTGKTGAAAQALTDLATERLRQIGDERAAFESVYAEFVQTANELITEIGRQRGASRR